MLTSTYEPTSSEDNFERKLQARIYPSNQFLEQPEEELIEFKQKTTNVTKQVLIGSH